MRASKTVGSTTTSYLYDSNRSLPMLLDDGTRKYVWGPGLSYTVDSAGTVEVFHSDGLGSTRAATNASASVTQTYLSDEFGVSTVTQGSSGQPFQYTGEQRDGETGFVYLRARMYDPQVGRFLQRDTVAQSGPGSQGWNRYPYASNSPVNATDPSGLLCVGLGAGGTAEAGLIAIGAAATGGAGAGVCWDGPEGISTGVYVDAGAFAGGPVEPTHIAVPEKADYLYFAAGAYAGVGIGPFLTNATSCLVRA